MADRSASHLPLVVIVGPTASGKTALAIELAEKFGGEIICADSRTVYKGMDIGTAKPTPKEQTQVPHWGLDLVEPGQRFTAVDFKHYANQKIAEIRGRHHVPFLVGGTGLYVDAIIFDYQFGPEMDQALRTELEKLSTEELRNHCYKNNIQLPENEFNKRYIIRSIEQKKINNSRSKEPIDMSIIVGIATNKEVLRTRIYDRVEQLFENGVVNEAIKLSKKYGWNNQAMTGNVYPLVKLYLDDTLTLSQVVEKNATSDWKLAKRQLTWLRRNPYIKWLSLNEARAFLSEQLANE